MVLATEALSCVGLCALATAAFHTTLYVRATVRWHRTPAVDPCDTHDGRRGAEVVRLVAAETVASFWLALAAMRPGRLPLGDPTRARHAVLLIAPAWLPARSLTVLGRRLARADALVGFARASYRARPAALSRVAARADALRCRETERPLALVFYGGASAAADPLCALLPRGVPSRLILLAPSRRDLPTGTPRAVTIWGDGDPWQTPRSAGGSRPTIALEAVGHLTVLVAPHVADVIRDACMASDAPIRTPIA